VKTKWNLLEKLFFTQCNINDAALKYFSIDRWSNLKVLHLILNKISNKGMQYLAKINFESL
jgi:hypothetical protein